VWTEVHFYREKARKRISLKRSEKLWLLPKKLRFRKVGGEAFRSLNLKESEAVSILRGGSRSHSPVLEEQGDLYRRVQHKWNNIRGVASHHNLLKEKRHGGGGGT